MEEYRRKYLSPSYLRSASITQSVQKDKTVSELRKQLQECKEMDQKFDDLCLEIVKLERENKKIESEQASIEGQHIEKIKKNKLKITELKQDVLDCRENIELRTKKINLIDMENQKLSQQIDRTEMDSNKIVEEKVALQEELIHKQKFMRELQTKIEQNRTKSKQTKGECQRQSQKLDQRYQQLKKDEANLKEEEKTNEEMKSHLEGLISERQLWEKKLLVSQAQVISLKNELDIKQKEKQEKSIVCDQKEKQNQYSSLKYGKVRSEMLRKMGQNVQKANKLQYIQQTLFEKVQNLQKSHEYMAKMNLKETELRKTNERLEEIVKNYSETLSEEQEGYKRTIGHMKESISQDEKAIDGLMKQANLLQNMIN